MRAAAGARGGGGPARASGRALVTPQIDGTGEVVSCGASTVAGVECGGAQRRGGERGVWMDRRRGEARTRKRRGRRGGRGADGRTWAWTETRTQAEERDDRWMR